jgi:hypothetical protein
MARKFERFGWDYIIEDPRWRTEQTRLMRPIVKVEGHILRVCSVRNVEPREPDRPREGRAVRRRVVRTGSHQHAP